MENVFYFIEIWYNLEQVAIIRAQNSHFNGPPRSAQSSSISNQQTTAINPLANARSDIQRVATRQSNYVSMLAIATMTRPQSSSEHSLQEQLITKLLAQPSTTGKIGIINQTFKMSEVFFI